MTGSKVGIVIASRVNKGKLHGVLGGREFSGIMDYLLKGIGVSKI